MLTGSEHPSLVLRRGLTSTVGADVSHGYEPWLKVQRTSDSLVMERRPPDAHELVKSGDFTFAPAATPSIVDALHGMGVPALRALLVGEGLNVHANESRGGMIARLLPLVEAGTVSLD